MKIPTKVTYVIPSLNRGGAEGQLSELLRRLDRRRFEPDLVLFEDTGGYDPHDVVDDVSVLNTPAGGNSDWGRHAFVQMAAVAKLTRHLRRRRSHVVHAFLPAAAILAGCAAQLARVPCFVISRRSMLDHYRKNKVLTAADRFPLRFADAIVGNCRAIAVQTVSEDRLPETKLLTIHNGVDTVRFSPQKGPETRQQLGFAPQHVVFAIVANFRECKRHIDFVHAAAPLRDRVPHARFLMVGAHDATSNAVQAEIQRMGLGAAFATVIGTSEPETYYHAMDVYVCTSASEGLSNSILEAMACGRPVIATKVGGNPELVQHGETGYLVAPFAPEEVASAGQILASHPYLRHRMGARARSDAEAVFSLSAMVERYENLYTDLLSGNRVPVHELSAQAAVSADR
jgi:glycosyltransferase involved in cell wall biosynthesis